MTVFQEMGIESKLLNQIQWSWYHFLLRQVLYLMVWKILDTFSSQGSAFWDTQYIDMLLYSYHIPSNAYSLSINFLRCITPIFHEGVHKWLDISIVLVIELEVSFGALGEDNLAGKKCLNNIKIIIIIIIIVIIIIMIVIIIMKIKKIYWYW